MTTTPTRADAHAKTPRHATRDILTWGGLLAWPAAITAYILHTTNTALPDLRTFDFISAWCVAVGAVALHSAALAGPRRWFSARVLTLMAAASAACALLSTVMVAVGRIDPVPSDFLVGLFLLLAPAVIGVNAAITLAARAAPAKAGDEQHLAAALETLENLSPQQAADCIRALQALHAAREKRPAALHVVRTTWESLNGSGARKR